MAFGISAFYAGIGGALYGLAIGFVSPDTFPLALSFQLLVGTVVGGLASIAGPLIGGVFTFWLPIVSSQFVGSQPWIPAQIASVFQKAGPAVTYGYWADAEKTRTMVAPNHFQHHFEEKMYRTGDIVTVGDDGNFYFQGRRDSMIKSRGYRIELGEIESALLSHPGVREAAVFAVPDEVIGNRIRAVVSAHVPDSLTALELQQYCSTRVPKYMIPEVIDLCDELPKTSTGKIDRVRLAQQAVAARQVPSTAGQQSLQSVS